MVDLTKAVPSGWAGPLSLWCVELAAGGRSVQTVGLRRAHVAQLARGVAAESPEMLTAGELLCGHRRGQAAARGVGGGLVGGAPGGGAAGRDQVVEAGGRQAE